MGGPIARIGRRYAEDGLAGLRAGARRRLADRIEASALPDRLIEHTREERLDREELLARSEREGRCLRFDRDDDLPTLPAIGERLSPAERERYHVYPLREYTADPPFVCELSDARLVGWPPIALSEGRVIVETLVSRAVEAGRPHDAIRAAVASAPLSVSTALLGSETHIGANRRLESACLLHNAWCNYYHWTLEHLPKLRALERYREETGDVPTLVIPPDPPGWLRESLWLAGGDSYPIVEYAPGRVDRLVVPAYPDPTRENCRWLCDRVRERAGIAGDVSQTRESAEGSERIFVSRRGADRRDVLNEERVMERLSELGFESSRLETLSVAQQARLFADAEIVVAPHGAGLTNLIYAEECAVLELFGHRVKEHYYRLAAALGFEYDHLLCEPSDEDMVADPDAVVAAVRGLLD
ncbi:MAG: glycosyltransferase family 61 protein [Halalkalicoccus sp.]